MSITKPQLKAIRADLDEALRVVGEKHGFVLTQGNCRFQTDTFTTKIDGMMVGKSSGNPTDAAKVVFEKNVDLYNRRQFGDQNKIPVDSYEKMFVNRGTEFIVVSCSPKAKQYPIIGQNANGTKYKFSVEDIK